MELEFPKKKILNFLVRYNPIIQKSSFKIGVFP